MKKYHFISGLPRSGTTLLSSLLLQNPKIYASIAGPLNRMARSIVTEATAEPGMKYLCSVQTRKKIIQNVFDTFYEDITDRQIVFDTSRGWTYDLPMIQNLFPESKVIICVRDLTEILNSFEQLYQRNCFENSKLSRDDNKNVFTRCEALMRHDGILGYAYNGLKQALVPANESKYLLVEYKDLASNPKKILTKIYDFINEPHFKHDFNNVKFSFKEYDDDVQIQGLHNIEGKVELKKQETFVPSEILSRVINSEFWRN